MKHHASRDPIAVFSNILLSINIMIIIILYGNIHNVFSEIYHKLIHQVSRFVN